MRVVQGLTKIAIGVVAAVAAFITFISFLVAFLCLVTWELDTALIYAVFGLFWLGLLVLAGRGARAVGGTGRRGRYQPRRGYSGGYHHGYDGYSAPWSAGGYYDGGYYHGGAGGYGGSFGYDGGSSGGFGYDGGGGSGSSGYSGGGSSGSSSSDYSSSSSSSSSCGGGSSSSSCD
ncbi:hypothetical protein [Nocardia sp. NPDC051832]|uniref:hypothetical protein n=1 Tax=Nocardia sp. NPDC051832 TaxID=3155673 RepID=UPI0034249528